MGFYAAAICVSAFLLFLVQPLIAKQILPWFGGSDAVWTTCLVFFQVALLAGYAYSDLVVRRLALRKQVAVHAVLLALSLTLLPIVPGGQWKPEGTENPSWLILAMLAATIGLPYLMLSTTSPIVQSWFAHARPGRSPYRLFALSNAASMVALLGYPFLLEPWIPTRAQAFGWSVAYAAFVALCITAGWLTLKAKPAAVPEVAAAPPPVACAEPPAAKARRRRDKRKGAVPAGSGAAEAVRTEGRESAAALQDEAKSPGARQLALWTLLAATSSIVLLAVSNHITRNLASVPLLWLVPLAIYLATFVVCFSGVGFRRRGLFLVVVALGLCVMAWMVADPDLTHELPLQIGICCGGLFLICMFCHGELARSKPAPLHLTRFYLMIALGGAAGSVLVGVVAPLVLPAYFELAGGLVLTALLLVWQVRRDDALFKLAGGFAVVATIACGVWAIHAFYDETTLVKRNFYGVLRVQDAGTGDVRHRTLLNGSIRHGMQFVSPLVKAYPTTYYVPTSGIGRLLAASQGSQPLRVGIVGLGIGTLGAYGKKGDIYRFYDINPDVIAVAQREFTYLKDSDATIELVTGDARLQLEREPSQGFDVLVVDAFFGDAIPMHLLTTEAMAVYRKHMKPGGVMAFHLTNRYLNLVPVVAALAEHDGFSALFIADEGSTDAGSTSLWALVSDRRESLERPELARYATAVSPRKASPWTDDFNNLLEALK